MSLFPVQLDASPHWNSRYHRYWNKYLGQAERFVRVVIFGEPEPEHPDWALIMMAFPDHVWDVPLEPIFGDDIERWAVRLQDASTAGRIVQSDSASSSTSSV